MDDYWKKLLIIQASRSSGPGGQGVNKTESRIDARFHIDSAPWLSDYQKNRLYQLFRNKINLDGELIVTSQVHRSQKQNLEECFRMFEDMFKKAAEKPKKRVATKATRSSKERRLKEKKSRSGVKSGRQTNWSGSD